MGLGDDQHDFGFEQELDPWADGLWAVLGEVCPMKPHGVSQFTECRYVLEEVVSDENPIQERDTQCAPCTDGSFVARVEEHIGLCTEKHSTDIQDVYNVRLSTPVSTYKAGDVCVVWPKADETLVRRFIVDTLGLDPKMRLHVRSTRQTGTSNFPSTPLTLESIFTSYVDISSVPTRPCYTLHGSLDTCLMWFKLVGQS